MLKVQVQSWPTQGQKIVSIAWSNIDFLQKLLLTCNIHSGRRLSTLFGPQALKKMWAKGADFSKKQKRLHQTSSARWRSLSQTFLFQIVTRPLRFPIGRPSTGTTCETLKTFGKALRNPRRGRVNICKTFWLRQMLSNVSCVRLVLVCETCTENIWDSMLVSCQFALLCLQSQWILCFQTQFCNFPGPPYQFAFLRNCFNCPTLWSKYSENCFF